VPGWLAVRLTITAGWVDAVGYIPLLHLFTAHRSGNSVTMTVSGSSSATTSGPRVGSSRAEGLEVAGARGYADTDGARAAPARHQVWTPREPAP
jgi:hypothetical protein